MKKIIASIIFVLVLVLSFPITFLSVGFLTPPQFDGTYYGELKYMTDRLSAVEEKKIVIIGNSAVAFGVRSDLLELELSGEDVSPQLRDRKVINFGLYGAIGTKAMLDLSKHSIKADDIIIISPEIFTQSMSLYFSAGEFWNAADSDFSMLTKLGKGHGGALAGDFINYATSKYKYIAEGKKPSASGAYSQGAFNNTAGKEVGYMTFERDYNIMLGGYDANFKANIDPAIIGYGFIDYLNEYAAYAQGKGATVFFGFTPVNEFALQDNNTDKFINFYNYLEENLNFGIIGRPEEYVLDYDWFYDNNVHMNSSGMYLYTYLLCEDIKNAYGDYSKINITIPEKPIIPVDETSGGNNIDAGLFEYEVTEYGVNLTALKETGKVKTSITLPSSYDGISVVSFSPSVFAGNTSISEIVIPASVREIQDYSFSGCTKLRRIIMQHDNLIKCSAGNYFLAGTRDDCYIYVTESAYGIVNGCAGGWLNYSSRIKPYS